MFLACSSMLVHCFNPETSLLGEAAFVLCLDAVGAKENNLYLHVSKPPKEGSAGEIFMKVKAKKKNKKKLAQYNAI